MANNSITSVSTPRFNKNSTREIKETTSSGASKSWGEHNNDNPTYSNVGVAYGICSSHYARNTLYNHLVANSMMPAQLSASGLQIYADDINSLKTVINAIRLKWKESDGTSTYTISALSTKIYTSENEKLASSATAISNNATSNTIIDTSIWSAVRYRLELFSNIDKFASLALGSSPSTDTTITKADYNTWVKAIETISKACKCDSDCACNAVCACNSDCGCNYSDTRLKDNISEIDPRIIDSIKPIKFKYKLPETAKVENDRRFFHYGIEAQSLLESEIKDSGALKQDKDGFYKVDYQELIGILIAEVQDLRKEINILKGK